MVLVAYRHGLRRVKRGTPATHPVPGKHMAKLHLKLVTPATVKRTVTPRRLPNADLRTREHLTEGEVERLMGAARKNRWGPFVRLATVPLRMKQRALQ